MHPRATTMIAKLSALRRLEVVSANLAIGAAGLFVAAVAIASLAADRDEASLGIAGGNWSLRGTLAPYDQPADPAGGYGLPVPLSDALTRLL